MAVRMGMVIIMCAIFVSMGAAMYMYVLYQPNYIQVMAGDTVTIGPVEYVVTFEGTHEGSKEVAPKNTFVMIGISAENTSNEETLMSGGQFYIIDEKEKRHKAVRGEFSENDLWLEKLKPGKPIYRTTQFDVAFDEDVQYEIVIRPQKEQSTVDTAVVCLTNC